MPYVATDYLTNSDAPMGQWTCTRTSSLGPFASVPEDATTHHPSYCGQCVSFVTTVCASIPVSTSAWKKGKQAKGDSSIAAGTAIATFNALGKYYGHAAIYESQNAVGIVVVDQWVTAPATAIHRRTLKFGAANNSNNGDNFFVVD